jgi:site-specific DNA-methyltransferase (adenine-specific)/adenine-specific DNA-methyltransferase
MPKLTDTQRQHIIELLQRGEDLPLDYKHLLFPPERQEYELVYAGKEREEDILAETMAVPLQPIRTYGGNGNGWHNMLIFGDNLQAMKTLLKMKEEGKLVNADGSRGVRLIYIDPPFGTGDEYGPRNGEMAYSAKTKGVQFIEFLRKRLVFMRELLTNDGSIYVRLDYHFGHYIKAIMDEVFGLENFQNEIVINRFKRQLSGLKKYNVATDSLFYYTASGYSVFNQISRSRLCSFCGQTTPPEWRPMSSPGLRNPPERVILGRRLLPPRGRHWTFTQEKVLQMEAEGRIRIEEDMWYVDIAGNRVKGLPQYLQTEDTPVDSNWTDLKGYVFGARYPTENPEELLERVIQVSSNKGDIVLDAFAGSGTTLAVAEKLGRRWIGIDCGKLAIYTMQKRLLNLKSEIGNKGKPLKPKPFTLYNAGLYDFARLKELSWEGWRTIALDLFQCRDKPHKVGGIQLDGYRGGDDVLVFNHKVGGGVVLDYGFIDDLHAQIGSKIGSRFFIIAPAASVTFLEDYIQKGKTRYYILRIPYSIINELHSRDFEAIKQPTDETQVNETVEAVGFDFIRQPKVECEYFVRLREGEMFKDAVVKIKTFKSEALAKGASQKGNRETLSMVLVDYDYPYDPARKGREPVPPFELDAVYYANDIQSNDWEVRLPLDSLGEYVMLIYIDIYGNEYTEVKARADFGNGRRKNGNKRK